jgi:protein-S-isoprenylcysteine O-methyltransferase Ste14
MIHGGGDMTFNIYFIVFLLIFIVRNIIEAKIKPRADTNPIQGLASLLVFIFSYFISAGFVLFYLYSNPPSVPWVFIFGLALYIFSYIFRVRSINVIKESYSQGIVPQGQLVSNGIYGQIRHPLYFFYCVEMVSFLLLKFNLISLVACAATIGAALFRINQEDNKLAGKFGSQFQEYKSRTRKFIPFIW